MGTVSKDLNETVHRIAFQKISWANPPEIM